MLLLIIVCTFRIRRILLLHPLPT